MYSFCNGSLKRLQMKTKLFYLIWTLTLVSKSLSVRQVVTLIHTQSTWAVRGLAVGGFLPWPLAVSPSVCRCRVCAAPGAGLQSQTPTGQRTGAPGAPEWQTSIHWAVLQGTIPPAMFTDTTRNRSEWTWKVRFAEESDAIMAAQLERHDV